ncbi:MAG: hypothetical protein BWY77_01930 [bacterium ADurb.Bin431]|nr:MAG: hypothetical protein BWY77_01930 [bacterium ADurb.Bin431]
MNDADHGSKGFIDDLIAKLPPKLVALLAGMALLLLAIIIGIAVYQGKDVKLFGIEISQPSRACQEDLARCEKNLLQAVPVAELQQIIGRPLERLALLDTLRALADYAGEAAEWRDNYNYRLFEMEKQMQRFGGFISTRIRENSRSAAYRMIQELLSEVDFYNGELNGNQQATYAALVAFQQDYNMRVPESEQITSLGSFGYQTLEALRSRYRQLSR